MKEYQIALLEGDGIGPEIIHEGRKVLEAAARAGGISLRFHPYPSGAEHCRTPPSGSSGTATPSISARRATPGWPPACWRWGSS